LTAPDTAHVGTTPLSSRHFCDRSRTAIAWIVLVGLTGTIAYFDLYSKFQPWDDEGYMLRTVQDYLDGYPLYDEIREAHGPVYYLYEGAVHGRLGLPVTNDAVRLNSLVFWCLTAFLSAVAVLKVSRNNGFAALAFLATFLHLRAYPNEPGHPQELCGLLIATVLVLPTIRAFDGGRGRWVLAALLGAATAATLLVKINVGVFLGVSLLVVVSGTLAPGWLRRVIRLLAACAVLALPWALMRGSVRAHPELAAHVVRYSVFVTLTAVPVIAFAWLPAPRLWAGLLRPAHLVGAVVAFAATVAAAGAAVVRTGSTWGGMVDSLVVLPWRLAGAYNYPLHVRWPVVAWSGVAFAAAAGGLAAWRRGQAASVVPAGRLAVTFAFLKLGFGCLVFLSTFWAHHAPHWTLFYGSPFVWLVLVAPFAGGDSGVSGQLARLVAASVAITQILQPHPVAGSQVSFGSFAVVPVAVVCFADAWAVVWSTGLMAAGRRRTWSAVAARALAYWAGGATALVAADTYSRYVRAVPLGLPGAERVRVTEGQATLYRDLVAAIASSSDAFVVTTSFNSLYIWTCQRPPGCIPVGQELNILTEDEQTQVVRDLLSHLRPMVVHDVVSGPDDSRLMMREIHRQFRPWRRVGPYLLMVPKETIAGRG
jgi:hypothetical protein